MGKRGFKPKPSHLKILEGVDEYRINRDEPTPSESEDLTPPVELSVGAEEVWNRLVPDMASKRVLTPWDLDQFVVFCEAVAMFHDCRLMMGSNYVSTSDRGGQSKSAYWQIMRDCQSMMTQIGSRYGLTPGDRASLSISSDDAGNDSGAERLLS